MDKNNKTVDAEDLDSSTTQQHIEEKDFGAKRRAALAEIDNAKFGWFHVRACLVAGIGFFTDAYDIFAINLVSTMIGFVYYKDNNNYTPKLPDLGLKVSVACGTFCGQLLFGWLADRLGRKKMYGIELMIIIVASVGSALSGNGHAVGVIGTIIFWRFILGIGIGGDYPLSAVITSEFATTKRRGAMMAAVFSMQGFGILAAGLVSLCVVAGYKDAINADVDYVDYCWRIVLGMGAVPGAIALYYRLTIPETPRYTMDIERNIEQAATDITNVIQTGSYKERDTEAPVYHIEAPRHTWKDFITYFGKWENGKVLLGTSLSWFFLDIAFYGLGLNSSIVLQAIGFAGAKDAYSALMQVSLGNVIITIMGTIPGYWFSVLFIDSWGRKPIQLMGFSILTVLFLIIGFAYYPLKSHVAAFIVLFTLAQFFQNFGPNTTTFVVPGEVFPTRYRSTGHGISAASGKLGAIVAQVLVTLTKDYGGQNAWVPHFIEIFAFIMFLGIFSTLLIPETKGRTLEELSNEDQKEFVKTQPKQ